MTGSLAAAAADYHAAQDEVAAARARLRQQVRAAHKAGVPKVDIHRISGVSRPTIDAWTREQ